MILNLPKIFKKKPPRLVTAPETDLLYAPPAISKIDTRCIEKVFARLFATQDGQKALAYLQRTTFHRVLGPDSGPDQLRHLEGQRAAVATIVRLVERGRKPK